MAKLSAFQIIFLAMPLVKFDFIFETTISSGSHCRFAIFTAYSIRINFALSLE